MIGGSGVVRYQKRPLGGLSEEEEEEEAGLGGGAEAEAFSEVPCSPCILVLTVSNGCPNTTVVKPKLAPDMKVIIYDI